MHSCKFMLVAILWVDKTRSLAADIVENKDFDLKLREKSMCLSTFLMLNEESDRLKQHQSTCTSHQNSQPCGCCHYQPDFIQISIHITMFCSELFIFSRNRPV